MQEQLEWLSSVRPIPSPLAMPDFSRIEKIGRNVSSPTIRRTNSYEIHFHVRTLKHKYQEPFETLFVAFDSWDTAKPFTVGYELSAGNVPNVVHGQLHVIVEVAETRGKS